MENLSSLICAFFEKSRETGDACIEYITQMVNKNGGYIEFDIENEGECVNLLYGGGRHPEYSCAMETLYGVECKNGEIVANMEYDNQVLKYFDTFDLVAIAKAIEAHFVNC